MTCTACFDIQNSMKSMSLIMDSFTTPLKREKNTRDSKGSYAVISN
jgi:hypothetical protein